MRVYIQSTKVHKMETTFEKQEIQFKIIDEDLMDRVCDFMWKYFFPDEPVCRSLNNKHHEALDNG